MRIEDRTGRNANSGYGRVFNNNALGLLISKVQATVISNGSELERMILSQTNNIPDLEKFIASIEADDGTYSDGVYVCKKRVLKKSKYAIHGYEPDLLVFVVQKRRICSVIELKDGDAFDTKKSKVEKDHLEHFTQKFGTQIPFTTQYYVCCFNQDDKEQIKIGFKNKLSEEHILTGRELCDLLQIDYEKIVRTRQADAESNLRYFLEELVKIEGIKEKLVKLLKV